MFRRAAATARSVPSWCRRGRCPFNDDYSYSFRLADRGSVTALVFHLDGTAPAAAAVAAAAAAARCEVVTVCVSIS